MLEGGRGSDVLFGGGGPDRLFGDDVMTGSFGADRLTGERGADIFVFRSIGEAGTGVQRDRITDFSRSDGDKIDLSGIDADTTQTGDQAFRFIGSVAFSGTPGELRQQGTTLRGDVTGDGVANVAIEVEGFGDLRAGDFIL